MADPIKTHLLYIDPVSSGVMVKTVPFDGNDIAGLDFVFYKKLEKRLKTVKTVLKARYRLK